MARCFYCADELDGVPEPEHILPAAINAGLTTRRVCTPCNHWAGTEVDRPWLETAGVREARLRWKVPDRWGGTVSKIVYKGALPDGDAALIVLTDDNVEIRRRPQAVDNGDTITLTGYNQPEYAKAIGRLRQRYPNLEAPEELTLVNGLLTATVNLHSNVHIWPRFVAKVALGVASLVADDSWIDSSDATGLRGVLRHGHYTTEQAALDQPGVAWSAIPLELRPGTHPLLPPQHLLTFESTEDEGEWLVIVVFGQLLYRVPLNLDWPPSGPQSWLFSEGVAKPRQLPAAVQFYLLSTENGWQP